MLDDFTKETGIKVNYEVMDSNELLETKLRRGPHRLRRGGALGLVPRPPDQGGHLPEARQVASSTTSSNLDPDITKRLEVFDPGNEHAVNYMWGTSGVAYNEEAIKAAHAECAGR